MKQSLLFGDYSWNECDDKDLPEGVKRVSDWDDVLSALLEDKAEA